MLLVLGALPGACSDAPQLSQPEGATGDERQVVNEAAEMLEERLPPVKGANSSEASTSDMPSSPPSH